MAITHTHTRTEVIGHPWAETTPWDCLIRETGCCSPTHAHSPMVGDRCAWPHCDETLRDREVCYAVIEVTKEPGTRGESWVCWRHVRPDDGPLKIT